MKRFFFTLMAVAVCIAVSAQCSHHCNHACGAQNTCKDSLNIPVYIVDGVEVQEISSISPDDVLSVNVVTDPAVCRIFAPRLGGVILITTKSKTPLKKALSTYQTEQQKARETAQQEGKVMIR